LIAGAHGLPALEAMRGGPKHCPGTMNTPKTDAHPVELLLLAGMALIWATITLLRLTLVPLLALVLVLLTPRRRPAPEPAPVAPEPPAPAAVEVPTLATIAADLMALPATQLQAMAGTRRRLAKRELAAMICAMPI
jgi:hypothetical protein